MFWAEADGCVFGGGLGRAVGFWLFSVRPFCTLCCVFILLSIYRCFADLYGKLSVGLVCFVFTALLMFLGMRCSHGAFLRVRAARLTGL